MINFTSISFVRSLSLISEKNLAWKLPGIFCFKKFMLFSYDCVICFISNMNFRMQCHVIHGSDIEQDLQSVLEADDLAVVLGSKHRPRCIIEFISQTLRFLNLEDSKRNFMVILCVIIYIGILQSFRKLMRSYFTVFYLKRKCPYFCIWIFYIR